MSLPLVAAAAPVLYLGAANHLRAQAISGLKPPSYQLEARYRVSVCVPTYNEAKYIEGLLISCRNQTEPVAEVVLADCSEDATAEIARSYGAKVVRAEYGNPSASRNLAASAATGDLLIFADGDMVLSSKFVEKATDKLEDGAVMAHPMLTFYDSMGFHLVGLPFQLARPRRMASGCHAIKRQDFNEVDGFDVTCNPVLGEFCLECVDFAKRVESRFGVGAVHRLGFVAATSARRWKKHTFDSQETFSEAVRRQLVSQ